MQYLKYHITIANNNMSNQYIYKKLNLVSYAI